MSFLKKIALFNCIALISILTGPSMAAANPADEAAFLRDLNALRVSQGLHELCVNPDLTNMARAWSEQMARRGAISHNPNMSKQAPAVWTKLGENVGVGGTETAIHNALVKSPGHYANLVDAKYTEVGIGVVQSNGRIYVTQNFMASNVKPAARKAAVAPASTPYKQRYEKVMADNKPLVDNTRSVRANVALGR